MDVNCPKHHTRQREPGERLAGPGECGLPSDLPLWPQGHPRVGPARAGAPARALPSHAWLSHGQRSPCLWSAAGPTAPVGVVPGPPAPPAWALLDPGLSADSLHPCGWRGQTPRPLARYGACTAHGSLQRRRAPGRRLQLAAVRPFAVPEASASDQDPVPTCWEDTGLPEGKATRSRLGLLKVSLGEARDLEAGPGTEPSSHPLKGLHVGESRPGPKGVAVSTGPRGPPPQASALRGSRGHRAPRVPAVPVEQSPLRGEQSKPRAAGSSGPCASRGWTPPPGRAGGHQHWGQDGWAQRDLPAVRSPRVGEGPTDAPLGLKPPKEQ